MTAADVLRGQLAAVGGIVSRGRLADEWGWTRSHVHHLSLRPDFPAPVAHETPGRPLYARAEAEEWRRRYLASIRPINEKAPA